MCSATLLPDPDRPLRMTMRTVVCYPAAAVLAKRAAMSAARRAPSLRGMMICALLLVLLDAAVQLVRQQVDGRVHVLLGGVGVDGAAAHVQGRLGLLSQLLHRQHAVHV